MRCLFGFKKFLGAVGYNEPIYQVPIMYESVRNAAPLFLKEKKSEIATLNETEKFLCQANTLQRKKVFLRSVSFYDGTISVKNNNRH